MRSDELEVPGYVQQVHIDDNEHVRRDQLLVQVDPRDFDAALRQARANLKP